MKPEPSTVYLLDDEPGMLKALARLLKTEGFNVEAHSTVKGFLEACRPAETCCLVLDVSMPELDGMELHRRLTRAGILIPIVFLTGHGNIPMSVRAIKEGAVDFLTKPVNDADLVRAVRAGLKHASDRHNEIAEAASLARRYALLTPREQEVMSHVITGKLNKQIAADLCYKLQGNRTSNFTAHAFSKRWLSTRAQPPQSSAKPRHRAPGDSRFQH